MDALATEAVEACQRLIGKTALETEQPGGGSRDSVRLILEDRSVFATRRKKPARAQLEVVVMRALREQGAPVPAVLASDGLWMIQEDLGPNRLSQALQGATRQEGESLLDRALSSLAEVQAAGRAAKLDTRVVTIGATLEWISTFIDTPRRLGEHLDLPAPALAEAELVSRLRVTKAGFIKWDARPGNAILRAKGSVAWFDWEHSGARNPLDDLAWLLGDEYLPDWPEVEARLLTKHLGAFADPEAPAAGRSYLAVFGTFHMCVRLALILSKKGEGPWWDWSRCLARDKVGVSLSAARTTSLRAARWASRTTLTEPLVAWLEAVAERLRST